jgi:hypothetical protein
MAFTDDTHVPFGGDVFAGLSAADVSEPELWRKAQTLAFYANELELTEDVRHGAGAGRPAAPVMPRGEVDSGQHNV